MKSYAGCPKAEPVRQALDKIKKMLGTNTDSIVCHNPESGHSSRECHAVDFCNEYKDIVESHGLTITL